MKNYQKFNILSWKAALIAIVFIQIIFIYYNFLSRYSTNVNKITILKNKDGGFIHSFNNFLSTNNFSHINNVLGIENTEVNKTDTIPTLMEFTD